MSEKYVVERESNGGGIPCESGGDYILPDYLPEVRRILRVDCQAAVSGQYTTADAVEVGGECRYYLLYSDEDGKIASAPLDSTFECRIPGDTDSSVEATVSVENVSCRPAGPRHVTIKSNLLCHTVSVKSEETEDVSPEGNVGETAVLRHTVRTGRTVHLRFPELAMTQTAKAEPNSTLLCCDGRVLIREMRCETGGARLRGEVWLSALCNNSAGVPYTVSAKLPVEEFMTHDSVTPAFSGIARGTCRNLTATLAEGENGDSVSFDFLLDLSGTAITNEEIHPVCDLYSTRYPLHVGYRTLRSRSYPTAMMANFTVDGSASREELGCQDAPHPIDCRGEATVTDVRAQGSEVSVEGTLNMNAILTCGEDPTYRVARFTLPYKVRLNSAEPLPAGTELTAEVCCVGCHCHADGNRLAVDAELAVNLLGRIEEEIEVACTAEADIDNPVEGEPGEIIAAYLQNGDSLWSVGKRYHVTLESLVQENSLPDEVFETPDAPYLLDGLTRLMLQRD